MSAKSKILSHLHRLIISDQPTAFYDTLTAAAEAALEMTRIDAEGFAAANVGRYWNDVLRQVEEDRRAGLIPFCDIAHRRDRLLRSASAALLSSPDIKERRLAPLLRARSTILRAMDQLTHREYEALGCLVSDTLGAVRTHLTAAGNEGGIDFFASIRLFGRCHLFNGAGREIRFVGQSKKYGTRVEVDKVESFITTLENVRKHNPRVTRITPPWFLAGKGAIIGWMIAHNGFQSGAAREARNHGIIVADSRDFAEVMSLARRYFGGDTPAQRAGQLRPSVQAYL